MVLSQLHCLNRDDVATVHPYLKLCIELRQADFPKIHCALWKVLVLAAAHFQWCECSRAHQAKKQDSSLVLDSCYKEKAFFNVVFGRWTEVTVLVIPHFVSWGCNRSEVAICTQLLQRLRFDPCPVHVGFMVDKVALVQVFVSVRHFFSC